MPRSRRAVWFDPRVPGILISHRDDPRSLASAIYGLVVVVSLLAVYGNDTGKTLAQIAGGIVVGAAIVVDAVASDDDEASEF